MKSSVPVTPDEKNEYFIIFYWKEKKNLSWYLSAWNWIRPYEVPKKRQSSRVYKLFYIYKFLLLCKFHWIVFYVCTFLFVFFLPAWKTIRFTLRHNAASGRAMSCWLFLLRIRAPSLLRFHIYCYLWYSMSRLPSLRTLFKLNLYLIEGIFQTYE